MKGKYVLRIHIHRKTGDVSTVFLQTLPFFRKMSWCEGRDLSTNLLVKYCFWQKMKYKCPSKAGLEPATNGDITTEFPALPSFW
jgi:hypothetical protein